MNLEVFCYLGLLRAPEQLESSLALLPSEQKAEAMRFLETVKSLPAAELVQRWSKVREGERAAVRQVAQARTGIQLDDLPPSLRSSFLAWLADQNGKDCQS